MIKMKKIFLTGIILMTLLCGCKHVESIPRTDKEKSEISRISTEEYSKNSESTEVNREESRYNGKYTIEELQSMYGENELEIKYHENGNVHILKGKIGKDTVIDTQQAGEVIKTLSKITGTDDTDKELAVTNTYSDGYTLCYTFNQVYNGILVYDSGILLGVGYEDLIPNYLKVETIPEEVLKNTNFAETVSPEELTEQYGGTAKKYIYALEEYKDSPIVVYQVKGEDKTLMICAENGQELNI